MFMKSQILELLGVLKVCSHSWMEVCIQVEKCRYRRGLGCDEGANCFQLVVQRVPKRAPGIADSSFVWCLDGMLAQFYAHLHQKRKNMDLGGDSGAIHVAIVFTWLPKV